MLDAFGIGGSSKKHNSHLKPEPLPGSPRAPAVKQGNGLGPYLPGAGPHGGSTAHWARKAGAVARSRAGKWDEVKLWQLGYRQELKRDFTMFNNMATCTSVLSFFVLVDTFGSQGLAYGGPVAVIWGWVVCSVFSLVVALVMAELLSAYPTSGGIYYWAWVLSPIRHRTLLCWTAGWLNLLGQVSFTAGLEYVLARLVATVVFLHTGGAEHGGLMLGNGQLLAVVAGMLAIHALLNCVSSSVTAFLNTFSFLWHVCATVALCVGLLLTARHVNPPEYVLTTWTPHTDKHGIHSRPYIFLIGLLMSQWTIMGYDASIHVVEETIDAEYAGSYAIIGAVCCCSGLGLVLLVCLLLAMPNMASLLTTTNATGGHSAIIQLFWEVFKGRYGSGYGAIGLAYVPLVAMFFCAYSSLCANARMLYAFSRDGAMPGARIWRRLGARSRLPANAAWLMALLALLLVVPCIFNDLFFATVSAGSVVALSLSYGIPIFLRLFHDSYSFIPGPFNLGRATKPLAAIACAWILLTSVVFTLPTTYPVTVTSANYTSALIAFVLALASFLFYAPGFGGRQWFTGPAPNLD